MDIQAIYRIIPAMGRFIVAFIVVLTALFGWLMYQILHSASSLSNQVAEQIKIEFISYATQIQKASKLTVAEISQTEVVERTSQLKLFNALDLPDIVVAISTPVFYTYYVDLAADWKFEIQNQNVKITAPALQPGVPAPDLSKTKFEVRKGSFFRNSQAALNDLQKEMTGILQSRAVLNKSLAREIARKQVEEFALHWLKEKFIKDQKKIAVTVVFADESRELSQPAR